MNSAGKPVLRYRLDLDNIFDFPDCDNIPIRPPDEDETWYTLCEIVDDMSMFGRPVYKVEDKLPGHYWTVAFFTDNPDQDARDLKCKTGSTVCIKDLTLHQFQGGYRVEDVSNVTVLPCTIAQLRTLNSGLRQRSDAGQFMSCIVCNGPAQHRCARCKSHYCSQQCQRQDWEEHKVNCKALKTLLEWNIVFA
ncbi:hypothetical protein EV421DRAFT_1767767 [Armillaria borealis]|uniref:MYND-type domain-containing protein n=1 Tax=Armillaria borealis TaxID=47425 RepID=A0AA39K0Q6_9AGAR|nr:hypothetical protein EV421DRAFT_1767767 [Armillaria borealis]